MKSTPVASLFPSQIRPLPRTRILWVIGLPWAAWLPCAAIVGVLMFPLAILAQDKPESAPHTEPTTDDSATALEQIRKKHGLVGLMAGYFDRNGKVEIQAVGLRKQGSDEKLAFEDRMHLGSCTKSMTATIIAMLVDEGKLEWDTPLERIFTDHPKLAESPWGKVTIEELLSHRSGAPANAPWWVLHNSKKIADADYRPIRSSLVEWLLKQTRPKKPEDGRHEFLYSNVGFVLLGHAIEVLCDETWEASMQRRIFDPLQMKSAGFGPPSLVQPQGSAWGHSTLLGFHTPVEIDNPLSMGPAGSVHASLPDWARYLRVHLEERHMHAASDADKVQNPFQLVSRDSLHRLHTARSGESYSGGWVILTPKWADGKALFHNGSNTVWYCVTFLALEQDRGFFAASNIGISANAGCDEAIQWYLAHNPYDPQSK